MRKWKVRQESLESSPNFFLVAVRKAGMEEGMISRNPYVVVIHSFKGSAEPPRG
jgi:hypothetical protein